MFITALIATIIATAIPQPTPRSTEMVLVEEISVPKPTEKRTNERRK